MEARRPDSQTMQGNREYFCWWVVRMKRPSTNCDLTSHPHGSLMLERRKGGPGGGGGVRPLAGRGKGKGKGPGK